MTILLTKDNKYLSMSSGGFPDKTLNTVEYNGEIPEMKENESFEWDDIKKELKAVLNAT